MVCPSCLTTNIRLQRVKTAGRLISIHACSNYKEQKLALYVQDHCQYRPAVISITGFRPHSKTIHFAPLFFTLKKFALGRDRPDFLTIGLNKDNHTVHGPTHLQEGGALPGSTPKRFPRPPLRSGYLIADWLVGRGHWTLPHP